MPLVTWLPSTRRASHHPGAQGSASAGACAGKPWLHLAPTRQCPRTSTSKESSWAGSTCHVGSGGRRRRVRGSAVAAAALQPGSSSSSPEQPCSLHACLLRHGITDLAAFSAPRHLALSQETVRSNVEPKLAALGAEGLSPKQIASVLAARDSLVSCSYADTFQPNLHVLREIAGHLKYRPHPKAPQLTALGKVLAGSPVATAKCLSRDASKVQQLLRCLESDLGIGMEQLAGCRTPCKLLDMSASSAQGAIAMFQERGVPVQQVVRMTLTQPTLLKFRATTLVAKVTALEGVLSLDAAEALRLVVMQPNLFNLDIKARLPPLLRFLDGFMGKEGAGRRLVLTNPSLGGVSAAAAERSIGSLAARGYSQQEIQRIINKFPGFLTRDLDSPLQQQKLGWIERVSPWSLDDFLDKPTYFTYSTRRLAARLALLRQCGLPSPSTPGVLAVRNDSHFMKSAKDQVARQGRELPWASWAEWEEAWLGTEEGREWGFPPLKD